MGSYSYNVKEEYANLHAIFMMLHIFFAYVFMLNYLVAILSTIYEQMMEKGDFAFKCNKYKYIERYNISFQDQWGYSELVVHSPPLNLSLIVLLLAVLDKNAMQSASKMFSMTNFWMENMFFISYQLVYELSMVPVIYIRVLINVVTLAGPLEAIKLSIAWIPGGIFYLMYGVSCDMYYFIKILCDYKMDNDVQALKQEEDKLQDNIVIYSEIVEVLKCILFIIKQKEK